MATAVNNPVSLSNIAYYSRLTIRYGLVVLLIFIVGRTLLTSAVNFYKQLNPAPPPPPTMGFGPIPEPIFPVAVDARPQVRLETVGNSLPDLGDQAPVYFMPSAQPGLLALDRAREQAAALGFVFQPEKVTTNMYRWRRADPIPASLEIDIVYGTMDLQVNWAESVTLLDPSKKLLPNQQQLTGEIRTLLRAIDMFPEDIATSSPTLTFQRALAGETRQVESVSEADFIEANIWRVTQSGHPTITAFPNKGIITLLFSGSRDQGERVLSLQSHYAKVSWETRETYPLRTAADAFAALQGGEGYVIQAPANGAAVVRSVELAYYEPAQPQNYYQPVYVFRGDEGFVAIAPALSPESYTSAPAATTP